MIRKFNNFFILGVVSVFISGCTYLKVQSIDRSLEEGISDYGFLVLTDNHDYNSLREILTIDDKLKKALSLKECSTKDSNIKFTGYAPIIAAFTKFSFDEYIGGQIERLNKIKKESSITYNNGFLISSEMLRDSSCIILVRYNKGNNNQAGFVGVLQLIDYNEGFVFKPIYIRLNDTVSRTKKPLGKNTNKKVNLIIAMSLKAIEQGNEKLPRLSELGNGIVTINNVHVSEDSIALCEQSSLTPCMQSDLIPHTKDKQVSISFAVTEVGHIGIDIDEDILQAKALKKALGPGLQESVKSVLSE